MGDFFADAFRFFFANYDLYMAITLSVLMSLIILILNFAKKPIKALTSKIKNERLRYLANKSIIILSFAFAILAWFILSKIAPTKFDFSARNILLTGAFPIVGYALGENVISTKKAKEITGKVENTVKDGKVSKAEIKDLAGEVVETKTGEQILDELLKK